MAKKKLTPVKKKSVKSMRTNKRKVPSQITQLCLFTPAEMRAMEERHVKFLPVTNILWELDLLPGLKGQPFRDLRTILLNKSLNQRLKVAPCPVRTDAIRQGVRVIDS